MKIPWMRRALGVLALLVFGFAFALGVAELAARRLWDPSVPAPPPVPEAWRDLEDLRGPLALGRPNLRAQNAGALFETNSAGFRGRERTLAKAPGALRIALIGDSFAMGWGVAEEQTYAFRLEQSLGARTDPPVEVLNFGLAGLDTVAAVERLHEHALAFAPDVVVYGFTVNDIENEHYRASRADLAEVAEFLAAQPWQLIRLFGPRLAGLIEAFRPSKGTYVYELDDNYFRNPDAWQAVLGALDRLAGTARARGMCAVVLLHTRLHFLNLLHPYRRHYDAFATAARERGLAVVPTLDAFLGRKDRDLWVAPNDPHPGPEAHGILADALERGLLALPPECLEGASFVSARGS